ncbi:MAG: glycosyltransferase family 9 protein [Verrucomicrobiales bacterium]|nr:glycosyltransferase family 9 protein [Verrucomicrobiales bacterium]
MKLIKQSFRKPRNYYMALLTEALWPLLRLYCALCLPKPKPMAQWKKVLILGDSHIGDILYRTHCFPKLASSFPCTTFYYLTEPGNAEILENNPFCIPLALRTNDHGTLTDDNLKVLRKHDFDAVFLTNTVHHVRDLKVAVKLKVGVRVGFIFKGLSALITHPIHISFPNAFPSYYSDFTAQITNTNPDWNLRPILYPSPSHLKTATEQWNRVKHLGPNILAAFITSRQKSGVWPSEAFAETLVELKKMVSVNLVLCGAKSDETVLNKINEQYNLGATILAGQLSLLGMCAFLKNVDLVFTTDSGPRHIANAANVPVVFVRNIWFKREEAGIYCDSETDLCGSIELVNPEDQIEPRFGIDIYAAASKIASLLQKPK